MPNLYYIEAHYNGEVVGTEHLVASSWEEAKQEASPHWPTDCMLWVILCEPWRLEAFLEHHCP